MPIINKINLASFNSKYGTEGGVNVDGSEDKEIRDSTPYSISRYFIIMNISWKSSFKTYSQYMSIYLTNRLLHPSPSSHYPPFQCQVDMPLRYFITKKYSTYMIYRVGLLGRNIVEYMNEANNFSHARLSSLSSPP